jgi:hypothetical protein
MKAMISTPQHGMASEAGWTYLSRGHTKGGKRVESASQKGGTYNAQRTLSSLEPSRDTVEVESMVAYTPSDGTV